MDGWRKPGTLPDMPTIFRSLLTAAMLMAAVAVLPGPAAATPVPSVLFAAAHPDDETIGMGTSIAEAVAAGQDVHVVLMTDGEGSGALDIINGTAVSPWWGIAHTPAAEGYAPLTAQTMAAARVQETRTALRAMASGLPGTLTLHQAHLPDGGVTTEAAQAAILAVADAIAPGGPVRLKGHSHVVDNHSDHLAVGAALRALKAADPVRFGDVRHYVMTPYWGDSRLSLVAEFWDNPTDAGITARAVNACRSYGAWDPEAGKYAIGYHSVYQAFFAPLLATPRSMVHP